MQLTLEAGRGQPVYTPLEETSMCFRSNVEG